MSQDRSFLMIAVAALTAALSVSAAAAPRSLSGLPMNFEVNDGQAPAAAKYVSRGAGYLVTFAPSEVRLRAGTAEVVMEMKGANPAALIDGVDLQPGVTNYFLGRDPAKWITKVRRYERVRYHDVYPGIDVVFYGTGGQLEYDWVLKPGADPERIRTQFNGIERARLDRDGDLVLSLGDGEMTWHKPVLYQESGSIRTPVAGRFTLGRNNEIGFAVGAYDRGKQLVIDPVLSYATYLGGSGDDVVFSLAVDPQGDAYAVGFTFSPNFPSRTGAGTNSIGFIVKINPAGTQNLATTFVGGGAGTSTAATAVTLDSVGNVYVGGIGHGSSSAIPVHNAIQPTLNGSQNGWVARFSSDLSTISYCTWLGGNGTDGVADGTNGIAVDLAQNLYVVGYTTSLAKNPTSNPNGFPVVNPIQAQNAGGLQDGFLTKINPTGTSIVYSTFIGGSGQDHPFGVAVDTQQRVYVTGNTTSCDFPRLNALQQAHGGTCTSQVADNNDVFLTAVKADGSGFIYSTYLGGDNEDRGRAIYADLNGDVFITGDTQSPTHILPNPQCPSKCQAFPTTSNAFQRVAPRCSKSNTCFGGDADAFITEVSPTGSLVYSTYYGGTVGTLTGCTPASTGGGCGVEKGLGILVQEAGPEAGTIYVAGNTTSTDFPVAGATQIQNGGGYDAFVVKIKPDNKGPLFSTYFGAAGDDYAYALARDSSFNVYVAGWATGSQGFFPPASAPPLYGFGGVRDGFLFKLSFADLAAPGGGFSFAPATVTSAPAGLSRATSRAASSNFNGIAKFTNQSTASSSSSDASGTIATVTMDNGVQISSCSSTIGGAAAGTCVISGNTITVNGITSFPLASELDVNFQGNVTAGATQGVFLNMTRSIQSATNDPNETNNSSTDPVIFVMNAGCIPSVIMNPQGTTNVGSTHGSGTLSIASCYGWAMGNSAPSWIHPAQTVGGAGIMSVSYTFDDNPNTTPRSGTLSIYGLNFVLTQAGRPIPPPPQSSPILVWANDSTGQVTVHHYGGTGGATDQGWNWMYQPGVLGWHVAAVADFNGDSWPDLVWQNDTTRQVLVHYYGVNGTTDLGWAWLYPGTGAVGWHVAAAADFNHDGMPDLVWQNDTTRQVTVHYYNGATDLGWDWLYPGTGAAGWHVAAAADFNGDGFADLVWQNDATSQVTIHYYAAGGSDIGWNWLYANTDAIGWHVAGALDFEGNGVPDLIWQNDSTRQVIVDYYGGAGGAVVTGWAWLYTGVATGWSVVN